MGIISDGKKQDTYALIAAKFGSLEATAGESARTFSEKPDDCFLGILLLHRLHVAEAVEKKFSDFSDVRGLIQTNILQSNVTWETLVAEFDAAMAHYQTPGYNTDPDYLVLVAAYGWNIYHVSTDPTTVQALEKMLDSLDQFDDVMGMWQNLLVASTLWFANKNDFRGKVMEKYRDVAAERAKEQQKGGSAGAGGLTGRSGASYTLEEKPFSSGGEGDIYRLAGRSDRVVKIYHDDVVTRELEEKLNLMAAKPPSASVLDQVAWPMDTVYENGRFRGFVMPKLDITAELGDVYVYPPKTGITYEQKLILAQNICVVIHAVHEAGYVFGDFNPRNIGVNLNTGHVAFLDTDSYHIVDRAAGKAYRCNVCAPGYCAPELLQKCGDYGTAHPEDKDKLYAKTPLDTFTVETDNFALAIHMFRLLMNGFTPFNGIPETETASTASPGLGDQAVKRDSYCFKKGNKPQAAAVPPLDTLPDGIQKLFTRAFIDGRKTPAKRPSAQEWHKALESYEKELVTCPRDPAHMYRKGLKTCPWCEADERYKRALAGPGMSQKTFAAPVTAPAARPQTASAPVVTAPSVPSAQLNTFGGGTGPASAAKTPTAAAKPKKGKGFLITLLVLLGIGILCAGGLLLDYRSQISSLGRGVDYAFEEDTGTLTVSGDGEIKDYSFNFYGWFGLYQPWNLSRNEYLGFLGDILGRDNWDKLSHWLADPGFTGDDVQNLVIEEGITRIGGEALTFSNITEVTVPESVRFIGYHGIGGSALETLHIADTLEHINDLWFSSEENVETTIEFGGTLEQWIHANYADDISTCGAEVVRCADAVLRYEKLNWNDVYTREAHLTVTYDGTVAEWREMESRMSWADQWTSPLPYEADTAILICADGEIDLLEELGS